MYTTILKQPVAGFFLTVRRRRNSLLGLLAISFAAWSASAAAEKRQLANRALRCRTRVMRLMKVSGLGFRRR